MEHPPMAGEGIWLWFLQTLEQPEEMPSVSAGLGHESFGVEVRTWGG